MGYHFCILLPTILPLFVKAKEHTAAFFIPVLLNIFPSCKLKPEHN